MIMTLKSVSLKSVSLRFMSLRFMSLWILLGLSLCSWEATAQTQDPTWFRFPDDPPETFRFPDDPPETLTLPSAGSDPGSIDSSPSFMIPSFKWFESPPPSYPAIDLSQLPLFPDSQLAEQINQDFGRQVADLNSQISEKQIELHESLKNWSSPETDIRTIQLDLSELRTERDRLALELLLLLRQLDRNFDIPDPVKTTPPL